MTTSFNTFFSYVSFFDVTDPANPCLMANKLLTATPETLSSFSTRGTYHMLAFAKGIGYASAGTAEFMLELLDGARQGRLADVALLRRPREVQGPGKRDEIAHLLHFHGAIPLIESARLLHADARERDTEHAGREKDGAEQTGGQVCPRLLELLSQPFRWTFQRRRSVPGAA